MATDQSHVTDEVVLDRGKGFADGSLIAGWVVAELRGPDGELKGRCEVKNLVTAVGDQMYAARGAGVTSPPAAPTGIRLGTGSTAVSKTGAGAALVSYLSGSGKAFDSGFPTAAGGVATYKRTFAAGEATSASPITDAALVNDTITTDATSSAANTPARVLLTGIGSKGAQDTLTLTWTNTLLGDVPGLLDDLDVLANRDERCTDALLDALEQAIAQRGRLTCARSAARASPSLGCSCSSARSSPAPRPRRPRTTRRAARASRRGTASASRTTTPAASTSSTPPSPAWAPLPRRPARAPPARAPTRRRSRPRRPARPRRLRATGVGLRVLDGPHPGHRHPAAGAEWSGWGQGDANTYGVPASCPRRPRGLPTPPSGDRVVKLRHSGAQSPFGVGQASGLHNMHKLYKQFTATTCPRGTEPTNREDGSPADVSGRYVTTLYIPSAQMAGVKGYWSNVRSLTRFSGHGRCGDHAAESATV